MKTIKTILLVSVSAIFLASCSSSLQQRQVADDLYYSPDKDKNQEIVEEFEKDYNKAIAENEQKEQQEATQNDTVADFKQSTNPYEEILVDDMNEAYNKREQAMRDPYYGMSNYYSVRFSDNYWYASAYDPMFYNMIVMGNSVWVEPKSISSAFGYGYQYGNFYNRPMSSWGFGCSHHPYSMNSFYPNSYGYGYGYGYNYGYYGYGYNSGYHNPYGYFNYGHSTPVKRKFPNRSSINNNGKTQNSPSITRYYGADSENKATINTKGRGDKIRTINRNDERSRSYIRKSGRNNNRSNISERRYDVNSSRVSNDRRESTAERYIGDRKNTRSTSNRYYKRPKSESNYNELRNRRTRSYNNTNTNKSKRYYNNNNTNNSSSSSISTRSSSGSNSNSRSNSSSSSSSSSSGRKKR